MAGSVYVGSDNRPWIRADWSGYDANGSTISFQDEEFLVDTGAELSAVDDHGYDIAITGAMLIGTAGGGANVSLCNIDISIMMSDKPSGVDEFESYNCDVLLLGRNILGVDVMCGSIGRNLKLCLDATGASIDVSLNR
ncbi:MAG: hypothetical protein HYX51_10525 [Chloroflexi bacterium]|nr:hypothetical protein [Chloroflexota bacterium]